ncbi:MAG: type IV secretion system protein VirB11 [Alphaproteobacteria bacterium]|nr:MAG: type IV secretion system protein VirB11 [Caulobacteraceae bacterium]TPW07423.1 MAG: type IV secretion system protein VirB11 [Alphaproteobacteria bacterium]
MSAITQSIGAARRRSALSRALGPAIAAALDAPDVVEALVNADGILWLDRVGVGLVATPHRLSAQDRDAAIRLLAHEAGETVSADRPMLSTILPDSAARVQALLPPLVEAPALAIRKRPTVIYTLDDYVRGGIATEAQADTLRDAIRDRCNVVVAGGTGSGKTTLLNALLAETAFMSARVVILEDTAELQCASPNSVQLLTKRTQPAVTMRDLVQMTLRLRPDRIVVGEVRDGAALEVLKAWNTGHPGGLLTLHANSAADALTRLEDLCLEAAPTPATRLIASAVDMVVYIARTERERLITDIWASGRAPNRHHFGREGEGQ